MNFVEPIRNIDDLNSIRNELKKYNEMYHLIFEYGIQTGLRISDILDLTIQDIEKDYIEIYEKKTGKFKKFALKPKLKQELLDFAKKNKVEKYLFKSSWYLKEGKPINRCQVYKIFNKCAKKIGYNAKIGTHTMRKTFGYHFYKQTHNVVLLQKIFNHSTPEVTLRYIGINQDLINQAYEKFDYSKKEIIAVTNEDLNNKICKLEEQIVKLEDTITACMNYGFDRIDKLLSY